MKIKNETLSKHRILEIIRIIQTETNKTDQFSFLLKKIDTEHLNTKHFKCFNLKTFLKFNALYFTLLLASSKKWGYVILKNSISLTTV